MSVTVAKDEISPLLSILSKIKELLIKEMKTEITPIYEFIQEGTPVGIRPDHAGTLKRSWTGVTLNASGVSFGNYQEYAPVLETGGYKGLGPRTVKVDGKIYSSQAPGGMLIAPLKRNPKLFDNFVNKIVDNIIKKML